MTVLTPTVTGALLTVMPASEHACSMDLVPAAARCRGARGVGGEATRAKCPPGGARRRREVGLMDREPAGPE
eukprot:6583992-Alexandrium_andersonii.AAC.1